MAITKVGPKHQVTIPKEVFEKMKLDVGDYLDVQLNGSLITMTPQRLVARDQAWFYTPEWQEKERDADKAIAAGEVSGPFTSASELTKHLRKRRKS